MQDIQKSVGDMACLSFNNQPESTDVGTKPKEGLKNKYIHFVKSMMAYEHNEPKTSVEKAVDPMKKENKFGIGYDIPESLPVGVDGHLKGPVLLKVTQGRNFITTTIIVSMFKRDTSLTTRRVMLKYTIFLLHALYRLKMRKANDLEHIYWTIS